MKTVTIALKEETYEAGQNYARKHRLSLNTLLRRLLEQVLHTKPRPISWERFFAAADRVGGCSAGPKWRREDLYRV